MTERYIKIYLYVNSAISNCFLKIDIDSKHLVNSLPNISSNIGTYHYSEYMQNKLTLSV